MQLVQVIQRVADPDQPLLERAKIERFQGEGLEELLELPHLPDGRRISDGLAGEAAAHNIEGRVRNLQ